MISAEARGQLRLLKRRLTASAAAVDAALAAPAYSADLAAYLLRGSPRGRARAAARLSRVPGVRWTRAPRLGAYLAPTAAVIDNPRDPGQYQDATAVRYVVITDEGVTTALWTLEVPDHALARLIERAPRTIDPASVLWSAHAAALAAAEAMLVASANDEFLLPAGPGYFVCQTITGSTRAASRPMLYVRPRTWLHADELFDNQRQPVLAPGTPAAGDCLLLPHTAERCEMTAVPRSKAARRHELVAALRAEMPLGFKWDFRHDLKFAGCGTSGCAIGLARIIWPRSRVLPHSCAGELGEYIGLEEEAGWRCYGLDETRSVYDVDEVDQVTPQMVADRIELEAPQ